MLKAADVPVELPDLHWHPVGKIGQILTDCPGNGILPRTGVIRLRQSSKGSKLFVAHQTDGIKA